MISKLTLLLSCSLIGWAGCSLPSPPNILFILVDDLGWNDVSWNNPQVIMPNLDSLARSGLILTQNYVQPTCSPSRTALLTGYYPSRTGYQFVPPNNLEPVGLPTNFTLLPEYLKKLGYSSHLAGKWHLGYCHPDYFPTNRGFESYVGLWNGGGDHNLHAARGNPHLPTSIGYDFHQDEDVYLDAIGTPTSYIIGDRINQILTERAGLSNDSPMTGKVLMDSYNASNPFFLYAAFQDVHAPIQVEQEFEDLYPEEEDPDRRTYLGMITRLDTVVGRIVSDLQRFTYVTGEGVERSVFDDTVIVFSSDNGGMSQGLGYSGGSNVPLRGRKGDMWEGGCRVPAFIANTGGATGETAELFHITDWLPTLFLGFGGGDASDLPGDLSGYNQRDMLFSPQEYTSSREEILYDISNFETISHTLLVPNNFNADLILDGSFGAAYRFNNYKLVLGCSALLECARNYNSSLGGNVNNNRVLLFDLATDPVEEVDLSELEEFGDVLEDLRSRFEAHLARAVLPFHRPNNPDGNPNLHFPLGQFKTGWCQAQTDPNTL